MKKIITFFLFILFYTNTSLSAELNQNATQDIEDIEKPNNTLPENFTPTRKNNNYLPRKERLKAQRKAERLAFLGIKNKKSYQQNYKL